MAVGAKTRRSDPPILQIEVTARCNFNCRYCIVHNGIATPADEVDTDMDFDTFRGILDRFPRSHYLQLQGQGEPLMLGDGLVAMAGLAEQRRRHFSIVSNGQLWTERLSRDLLKAGVDVVSFSMDLCDPARMESQRINMKTARVEENLRRLLSIRREMKSAVSIGVSAVAFAGVPLDEVRRAVRRLESFGIDFLVVGGLVGTSSYHTRYPSDMNQELLRDVDPITLVPPMQGCTRYSTPGLNFMFGRCLWPWSGLYISADGGISICPNNHRLRIGHVNDIDALNLTVHKDLREAFTAGREPDVCRGCQYLVAHRPRRPDVQARQGH